MVSTSTPKFILKSKTIVGILITLLPAAATLFGFTLTPDDSAMISNAADAVIQLLGASFAIYGRITAKDSLRV